MQGGDCMAFVPGFSGESTPSVLSRKCLSLSENFGLGIPDANDLNNGVIWIGELNSEFEMAQITSSSDFGSIEDGKVSGFEISLL